MEKQLLTIKAKSTLQVSELSSMASTSSISNLVSFFTPSNPPPSSISPNHPSQFSNPSSRLPKPQSLYLTSTNNGSSILPIVRDSNKNESYPSDELMSVVYPSLAYANTLYFSSGYNVQVVVEDNEPEERLLNRFRREVMRAGVIQESKRRRYFENKQDERKRKTREAAKRNSRRRRSQFNRGPPPTRQEAPKTKKDEDDDDNWEMPEGGLPF